MENFLLSDVIKDALKELLGYGVLGLACIVLSYTVYKLFKKYNEVNKKLIAVLERRGKRKDKQLELEEKLLEQNKEVAKSLIESANAQSELLTRLVKFSKKRADDDKE